MKKVAGSLKLAYSQFRELESFSQFGSDLDADTKSRLEQGKRIVEILKQPQSQPMEVEKQVLIIFAVVNGLLKDIAVENIRQFETELLQFISDSHGEILDSIRQTKELTPENMEAYRAAFTDFKGRFIV